MKHFLARILAFAVVLGAVAGCSVILHHGYFMVQPYRLGADVHTVMLGNSMVMLGLDPAVVGGSVNVAQGAEQPQMSYYKLRHILRHNGHVTHAVVNISPETFSENRLFSRDDRQRTQYINVGVYGIIAPADVLADPHLKRGAYVRGKFRTSFFNTNLARALLRGDGYYPFIGGFAPRTDSRLYNRAGHAANLRRIFGSEDGSDRRAVAVSALAYFERMADLCRRHGVALVLIRPPAHRDHRAAIPARFDVLYRHAVQALAVEPGVTVLDYATLDYPDAYYWDPYHLSAEGAAAFSRAVDGAIRDLNATSGTLATDACCSTR